MLTYARSDFLNVVGFADPAGPKRKQNEVKGIRAQMAAVVIGQTPLSHIVVLEAWADRTSTNAFIEKLFELNKRWHPTQFGIEENAQQGLFIDAADTIIRLSEGVVLPIVAVSQPNTVTKEYRVRTTLQPIINASRLILAPDQTELLSQIRTFPRSPLKDLIDALASACQLLPHCGGVAAAGATQEEELLAFLRASGAAPSEIERRSRELGIQRQERRVYA